MERVRRLLPGLLMMAGAAAVAYGGYGAGISQVAGAGWLHWLQVAGLMGAGVILIVAAMTLVRRATTPSRLFASEITALERLVPTVRRHRDGLTALQDLIEVVFEAHLGIEKVSSAETHIERRSPGGRDHA